MRKKILAAVAATMVLANTSWAQVDLGGTIQNAINGATGNAQAPTVTNAQEPNQSPPKAAVGGAASATANAAVNPPAIPSPDAPASARANAASANAGGVNASGLNASGQNAAGLNASGLNASGQNAAGVNASGLNASGQNAARVNASGLNNSGVNAAGTVNQTGGQGWLGRVGNDIRGALQQGDNGVMRLQNNLNPALQQYGFRAGDQLLDANGQPLTQAQFDQYMSSNPGQVRVLRNGQTVVINGNSTTRMQSGQQGYGQQGYGQQGYGQSGQYSAQSSVQSVGRQRFGITMNQVADGVLISSVTVGSPAALGGLKPGDQIVSVNGQAIVNPDSMIQLVNMSQPGQALDVQYRRNGQVMQSQVTVANFANNAGGQGNVYQAGYAQGMDNRQGTDSRQGGQGGNADINARLDQLERMVQDLRDQVQQLTKTDSDSQQPENQGTEEK